MFGPKLSIEFDGLGITLKAIPKKDVEVFVETFSSMVVRKYLAYAGSVTLEDEQEWWEKVRKNNRAVEWGIYPFGSDKPIGTTGIHYIHEPNTCITGIAISNQKWWGKGIASRAHLLRTLYAADYLHRFTIKSDAFSPNVASQKALERVGYIKVGKQPRTWYVDGKWVDTILYSWIHPERVETLFPNGLPKKYRKGVKKAKLALDKARELVKFP